MIRNSFTLVFICFFILSCNRSPVLLFTSEIFSEQDLAICKHDPCSVVDLVYPRFSGDVNISEKINSEVRRQITEALFLGDEEPPYNISIELAATQFIMAYRDHQPDIPSNLDNGGYDASIDLRVLLENEFLVSIENNTYVYTGGAHGNTHTTFINFDVKTGAQIDVEDLVSNFEAFEAFVEKKFRDDHDIPIENSINETRFMFEDEQFYVSTNVGLSPKEMIIVYHPFEIVPTPKGMVILRIPIEEVKPFLNTDLL